jgi:hypothetical protein
MMLSTTIRTTFSRRLTARATFHPLTAYLARKRTTSCSTEVHPWKKWHHAPTPSRRRRRRQRIMSTRVLAPERHPFHPLRPRQSNRQFRLVVLQVQHHHQQVPVVFKAQQRGNVHRAHLALKVQSCDNVHRAHLPLNVQRQRGSFAMDFIDRNQAACSQPQTWSRRDEKPQ